MVETEIAVKGLELAIDFVRGALEGAELEHLAALLTAKGAGRATGELFLQIFKKYRKADGTLKEVPLEDMRQIARSEPQVIGALFSLPQTSPQTAYDERKATLEIYVKSLNIVGTEIAKKKTSIALHGFLHCEDCISYWDYGTIGVGDNATKVDGSAINTRYRPEIYVIKMDPSDENLEQFNKAIRDKEVRRIPIKEVNAEELGEIVQVVRVDELMVDVQPVGSVGSDSIRREKIPPGLPGLKRMIQSLPKALEVQGQRWIGLQAMVAALNASMAAHATE